jgi:cob(I)alamin adenosyltransferase
LKIYTKTGDDGTTGLFSGKRVSKSSSYLQAYGSVDELNSFLGWAASICSSDEIRNVLQQIQVDLHRVGADLATPMDATSKISRMDDQRTEELELIIDRFEEELSPLKNFILPGGTELAARLHIARTVVRRAEREVFIHSQQEKINFAVIRYLNRLSDLLFVMARVANHRGGVEDIPCKA